MNNRTILYSVFALLLALMSGIAIAHSGGGNGGGNGGGGQDGGTGGGMGQGMADQGTTGRGTMGPGSEMMGTGVTSPGMMGPGMADYGMMGLPMMRVDQLNDEQLDQFGEQMQRMHEQMENIANAKEPEKRREAVRQHLQNMQAFMHQRRDMMIEQFSRRQGQDNWQLYMEERMRRMEEMMRNQ